MARGALSGDSPDRGAPSSARGALLPGLALAVAGSVLFSGKAIVVKLAYRHGVDPLTLIALRMAFAAPFFAVSYWWVSRGAAPIAPRDHGRLIALGVLGYYLASYLDFLGLQHVSAALERLILFLNPTIVLLLSAFFLAKRIRRLEWLALALSYAGIVLAFWHDVRLEGGRIALGSLLVFGSALCYALYLVIGGELVKRLGAIRLTSYAMCVSSAAVMLHFLLANPVASLAQPAPVYWLSLLNATLCTVLPVFATMLAIERIGAGRTSLAAMVGPVATIGLAFVFLGEPVSGWQLAGTGLVLAGVYVLTLSPAAKGSAGSTPKEAS
ncbi:MAG: DMT family transporter [Betaproteobacteria bacterium]